MGGPNQKNTDIKTSTLIRSILLLFLLMISTWAFGQDKEDVAKLQQEKADLQQQIDSLYSRIDEIDKLLGQDINQGDRLENMIKKYGKKKGPMIAEGRVWTGVSPEMALDSWGEPENRKKSAGTWGVNETWYYPEGKYIYFENGIVTKWKD